MLWSHLNKGSKCLTLIDIIYVKADSSAVFSSDIINPCKPTNYPSNQNLYSDCYMNQALCLFRFKSTTFNLINTGLDCTMSLMIYANAFLNYFSCQNCDFQKFFIWNLRIENYEQGSKRRARPLKKPWKKSCVKSSLKNDQE
jgi:hypothetical protein